MDSNKEKDLQEFNRDNCGLQSSEKTGKAIISGIEFSPKEVTYSIVDNLAIYEGCIVLGTVEEMKAQEQIRKESRGAVPEGVVITGKRYRWPNAVMPYQIDEDLVKKYRVSDAIAHWTAKTRVKFVKRTSANAGNYPNYVHFRTASGCWSYVGMRTGRQEIGLSPRCSTGNVIHEIGHALGLWHEQSREDRNNHVQIRWNNIKPNHRHNFNQHISDGEDIGPYDHGSIMHYGRYAFAIDRTKPTIVSNKPIGQRHSLSPNDIKTIHKIYGL